MSWIVEQVWQYARCDIKDVTATFAKKLFLHTDTSAEYKVKF
jgi:hypothetical protein